MAFGVAAQAPEIAPGRLKAALRAVLNRVVNRRRFNDSRLYRAYTGVVNPSYARALRAEEEFYRGVLAPLRPKLVFDIGANCGSKSRIFAGFGMARNFSSQLCSAGVASAL